MDLNLNKEEEKEVFLKEPSWVKELRQKYLSGESIMFVLHSNVLDLVPYENTFITLKEFLIKALIQKNKDLTAYYDVGEGLNFPSAEKKKEFFKALNLMQTLSGEDKIHEELIRNDPSYVLPIFEKVLKMKTQSLGLVLGYSETIVPTSQINYLTTSERTNLVTFQRWASDPELLNSNNLIILVTQNLADLNDKITKNPQVSPIEIPIPDYEDRLEYINYLMKNNPPELEMKVEQLAFLTAGLSRIQIQGLFRQAKKSNLPITFELIKNKKKTIIEDECLGLIEIVEPKHDLSYIGAMDSIKNYLKRVITNIKDGNYQRVPMGIFFVGPMGTGKTFVAEAFAKESGLTCIKLKNFMDKWVGSTEANLERILSIIKSLGSVLVIIDEVDRALSGKEDGDSGTSSRVYARIKAFMSDTTNRGKILWLIMSNRPDKLDIDLKRSGRFDSKIPFFYPQDPQEVENVILSLLKKNKINHDIKDLSKVVEMLKGYSGADIEAIILNAEGFAFDNKHEKVLDEDLLHSAEDFIPNRDSSMIEYMEYLAVFECSSRQMLPQRFKDMSNEEIYERLKELESIAR